MKESHEGAETRRDSDIITGAIIDAAGKLHQALGPGLSEHVYEAILLRNLTRKGFSAERQKVVRFEYDGMEFDDGLHRIVNNLNPSA